MWRCLKLGDLGVEVKGVNWLSRLLLVEVCSKDGVCRGVSPTISLTDFGRMAPEETLVTARSTFGGDSLDADSAGTVATSEMGVGVGVDGAFSVACVLPSDLTS